MTDGTAHGIENQLCTEYRELFQANKTNNGVINEKTLTPEIQPFEGNVAKTITLTMVGVEKHKTPQQEKRGDIRKLERVPENMFISPTMTTIIENKTPKVALISIELIDSCIERCSLMPNMDDLLNRTSSTTAKEDKMCQDAQPVTWNTHTVTII